MIRLSPSALDRNAMCPGSYWAEKGFAFEQSAAAAEGDMLHAVMNGDEDLKAKLTHEQRQCIAFCSRTARELIAEHLGETKEHAFEERAQWRAKDGMLSAKIDWWGRNGDTVLLIDWKFGRGDTEPAAANLQLRAYAVILRETLKPKPEVVVAAIVQPRADYEQRVTACAYAGADFDSARRHLEGIMRAVGNCEGTPIRVPGEQQCKYCKALGTDRCPESREIAKALVPLKAADALPVGLELGRWLHVFRIAEPLIDRIREHAREILVNGGTVPGWALKENPSRRNVTDPLEAFRRVADTLTPEQFTEVCSVRIAELESKFREAKGGTWDETKAEIAERLDGLVELREVKPSLVATGEKEGG